jgi:hypothetical protein
VYLDKIKGMEIILHRHGRGKDPEDMSTIGTLYVDNIEVVTLEDDYDAVKEYAHTRIPAGLYEIKLRTWGRTHDKYLKRFPEMHVGCLWLQDVPNYKYILIHCGNTPDDTAGCILVGMSRVNDLKIVRSTDAYRKIYPKIANELVKGKQVFINIID